MRKFTLLVIVLVFAACQQQPDIDSYSQQKIDSLQFKLDNAYKPGLGEFMSSIQVHHAKLWFAGTNSNWKLADFEIKEIQEALDDIRNFSNDRPETKNLPMIFPAMDSVNQAISKQNLAMFKSSFLLLTNTCNNCHRATEHAFNVITIPTNPPFSNQRF